MKSGLQQIRISSVELDREVQLRIRHDPGAIRDFSEAMAQGKPLPPIVVFYDGDRYWCGDGFHRVQAARKAKRTHISAAVRAGGSSLRRRERRPRHPPHQRRQATRCLDASPGS